MTKHDKTLRALKSNYSLLKRYLLTLDRQTCQIDAMLLQVERVLERMETDPIPSDPP